MGLTELKARQAKPKEKIYFLGDDEGLSLKVEPNGRKSWSYRYLISGSKQRRRVKLGVYPTMSLRQARNIRDQYHLDQCLQPGHQNHKFFKDVAEEWLDFKIGNSFYDHPRCGVIQLARTCLYTDIYPELNHIYFDQVKRHHLVKILKKIESRGVKEPVKKAYSYLNQIYDYAVAIGYCEYNIANGLNKILINHKVKKNYPYLKKDQIKDFLIRLNNINTQPIIKKALLFKLYTGVRGAELLLSEPHHFDLENNIWKIPALHIKQFRRKVIAGHMIPDFIIPLSTQAVQIIRSALEWSYGEKYIFFSCKKKNQPIHFNTLNTVIRKMGYNQNELSSHGLRSTFSTILNESGLFQQAWIETQLSHIDKNKTQASYNHAQYLDQRIKMMQWWGDFLDDCVDHKM